MPYGFNEDKSIFDLDSLIGSIATIETSPATVNHAKDTYIVYESQLYKVTQAIAVGEALVVGTNISATTTGAELTSLKSGLNNHFRQVSSGSIYDINEAGIYYLTGAVTNKPIAGGGVYIIGNLGTTSEFGIFVSAYSPEVFQVRNAAGTHSINKVSIDTVTVSGTTSSSGAVEVPTEHRGKRFLNALLTTGNPGFVIRRDSSYFTVFNNDGTPKANTAVVFDAYFN